MLIISVVSLVIFLQVFIFFTYGLLFYTVIFANNLGCLATCPTGWAESGHFCYWASNTAADYSLARTVCQDYEGELMAINSVEERNFVETLIGGRKKDVWFGLRANDSNIQQWWWTDGSTPGPNNETLKKWTCPARPAAVCNTGEPLGHCGIYRWSTLTWDNYPCSWTYPFVCRRSKYVVDNCDLAADWHQFAGRCYKNMDGKRSWQDARTECTNNAAQLVMLKNQTYIDAFKRMQSCFDYSVGTWIGLSDVDTETANTLKWVDGAAYDSNTADWASGQPPAEYPNPHKSNCVASYAIDEFRWRINGCGTANKFMCEKKYGICAEGWHDYGTGFCYQTVTAPNQGLTWSEARDICKGKSPTAQLMKISNQAEQNALKQMLAMFRDAGAPHIRIGLSDQQTDNIFRWSDGSSLGYTQWNNSWKEETVDRMDCGYVPTTEQNGEAKWGTGYCFDKMPYICRIPVHEPPHYYNVKEKEKALPELKNNWVCPSGWLIRGQDCYLFLDDILDYSQAKAKCEEHGETTSKPLTILNDGEQSFISNNLRGDTWLGLVYREGRWVWDATGSEPAFKNWANGGKGDGTNTCSKLQQTPPGQWHHANCAETYKIICKQPAVDNGTVAPTEPPEPTIPVHPECGAGWVYDQTTKNCFVLKTGTSVTWEEASRRCVEEMGGNLASITSPQEQTYINALLATIIGGAVNYWIGLNDRDLQKGWQWSDGEPVPYFNWADGEPNNAGGNEFCVELAPHNNGRWNDHNCSSIMDGYICKKKGLSQITTAGPVVTDPPPPTCTEPKAMMSGNMYVQDQFIVVSQEKPGREAVKARMNSGLSWEPNDMNGRSTIEVIFPFPRMVSKIQIAGAIDKDQWVTKFAIFYQTVRYVRWTGVYNGADLVIFDGNSQENKNDGVVRDLPEMVFAQAVRINPIEWHGNISMRFDVHGCRWEDGICHYWESVSGETRSRDLHMTASGYIEGFEPLNARFPDAYLGWETTDPVTSSWLQVQFDTYMRIIEVGTLGRKDENRFVKSYELRIYNQFSKSADKWETYQEPYGQPKTFAGNTNHLEAVYHRLNAEVEGTAVRFVPKEYEAGIAMKIEIKACPAGCDNIYVVSGPKHSIPDSHLTALTSFDNNHGPNRGRLFTESGDGYAGAWCSGVLDQDQWIQADIGYDVLTRGITIQGREEFDQWVKTFEVLYSRDGKFFNHVTWDGENVTSYSASWNRNGLRTIWFPYPHTARYIRINPRDWNHHISMRFDIQACPGPYSYQPVGCYADVVTDRDLPYGFLSSPSGGMTNQVCVHHCYTLGYLFAGTQNGVECFCGNSYGQYGRSSQCNINCDGDPYQRCGGDTANSVHTTGMSPSSERCADGWTEWEGRCYKFQKKTGTAAYSWTQAEYECKQQEADLVSINSQAENDFIFSRLTELQESAWIGLHALANTYHFEWTNYDMVTYTNWQRREPNNIGGGEDCVNMYNYTGTWNDDSCSANIYGAYVCEKAKESLPPASSPAPDEGCGEGWVPYRWKCYHILTQTETWDYHKRNCEGWDENSRLVQIKDNEEQAFLASKVHSMGGMFYTDMTDKDSFGSFKYSDGSTVHYTHWGAGQPNIVDQASCVAMSSADGGLWYDIPCGDIHGSICEKPSTTVTQGPTEPSVPSSGACADNWVEYGDYCYLIKYEPENFRITWDDALVWCAGMGANLASIHSPEDNEFLYKFHVMDTNADYWLGLSRADVNDTFKWSDGTELAYVDWANGQPSTDQNANCVEMMYQGGLWRSLACTGNKRSWMCKIARGVAPSTPATVAPPTAGPDGSCEPDSDRWRYYNERCYYFSDSNQGDGTRTWYDASTWCQQQGGNLLSIHDDEANNFTMGQVRNINSWIMWMGLNTIEGTESWSDGTPLQYTHWAPNQPDDKGGTEMCVGYGSNIENYGSWIHDHCSKKYQFICTKSKGAKPTGGPQPTPMSGGCPEGYLAYRDKCFRFSEDELTWQAARDKCYGESEPYSLASISNSYEQSFIISQLKLRQHTYWIGMILYEGIYVWSDSSHVTYTNWAPSEPNGGTDEPCVHIYHNTLNAGQWNDAHCERTMRYICMKYKDPSLAEPPEPEYCPSYGDYDKDYLKFDGQCYKATETPRLWNEAEAHCLVDEGTYGHLVSIMDPYEQAFLMSTYFDYKDEVSSGTKMWIGLSDEGQEGRFSWTDGRTVTYTNWAGNQPDEPGGGCVYMQFSDGKWVDQTCDGTIYQAVCKISDKDKIYTRPPGGSCPTSIRDRDWIEFGNDCYMFVDEDFTFANARHECQMFGTELVSIHSDEENKFIFDHIQIPSFSRFWWTGLIRTPTSGWQWTDNAPTEYTNWADKEPSDNGTAGENCVEMYSFSPGQWNDINCDILNGFICKTPRSYATPSSTPEPSFPSSPPTGTPISPPSSGPSTSIGTAPTQPATTLMPTTQGNPNGSEPLSPGAVLGIVFGVIAMLLLGIVIALVIYRRHQWKKFAAMGGLENPIYQTNTVEVPNTSATIDYVEATDA